MKFETLLIHGGMTEDPLTGSVNIQFIKLLHLDKKVWYQ